MSNEIEDLKKVLRCFNSLESISRGKTSDKSYYDRRPTLVSELIGKFFGIDYESMVTKQKQFILTSVLDEVGSTVLYKIRNTAKGKEFRCLWENEVVRPYVQFLFKNLPSQMKGILDPEEIIEQAMNPESLVSENEFQTFWRGSYKTLEDIKKEHPPSSPFYKATVSAIDKTLKITLDQQDIEDLKGDGKKVIIPKEFFLISPSLFQTWLPAFAREKITASFFSSLSEDEFPAVINGIQAVYWRYGVSNELQVREPEECLKILEWISKEEKASVLFINACDVNSSSPVSNPLRPFLTRIRRDRKSAFYFWKFLPTFFKMSKMKGVNDKGLNAFKHLTMVAFGDKRIQDALPDAIENGGFETSFLDENFYFGVLQNSLASKKQLECLSELADVTDTRDELNKAVLFHG
jgi:hypothetical protein